MQQTNYSRITTVSAFKKNLASMDVSEPVVVTQNGEPLYVVQDPVQFTMQQEQMALLRLLSFAEKDVEAGKTASSASLRKGLREWAKGENNTQPPS